jgi:hypothetical protein
MAGPLLVDWAGSQPTHAPFPERPLWSVQASAQMGGNRRQRRRPYCSTRADEQCAVPSRDGRAIQAIRRLARPCARAGRPLRHTASQSSRGGTSSSLVVPHWNRWSGVWPAPTPDPGALKRAQTAPWRPLRADRAGVQAVIAEALIDLGC